MSRWRSLERWAWADRDAAVWKRCGSRRKYPRSRESQLAVGFGPSAVAPRHSEAVQICGSPTDIAWFALFSGDHTVHLSLFFWGVFFLFFSRSSGLQEFAVGEWRRFSVQRLGSGSGSFVRFSSEARCFRDISLSLVKRHAVDNGSFGHCGASHRGLGRVAHEAMVASTRMKGNFLREFGKRVGWTLFRVGPPRRIFPDEIIIGAQEWSLFFPLSTFGSFSL
jgi:hypothetical protein